VSTYDVIRDYGLPPGSDYLSASNFWVMAVFRLKYPTTYDRRLRSSRSTLYSEAVELRGRPMVITDDVLQMSVTSSKSSYMSTAQAQLIDAGINYTSEIFPGDHVMIWMMTNETDYNSVVSRLRRLDSGDDVVNKFHDGLKFVGRVQSLRKKITQVPQGPRISRYTMACTSFDEFDAQLFYEPHLAEKIPQLGNYFGKLGAALNELVKEKGRGIDVNRAIPFFLDLLLGRGVPSNLKRGNDDPRLQATTGLTANYAYIMPSIIGKALGKTKTSTDGGLTTYADVLEAVIGVQSYSELDPESTFFNTGEVHSSVEDQQVAKNFSPEGTRYGASRRFADNMLGEFLPQTPHFYNKTVWTILQQYLNPAVNEMYTTLRVNPDGLVVPHLIVRQLPFSSNQLSTDLKVTRFLNLPRWGVDDALIRDVDFGRSNSARFNFIHVYGDSVDRAQPFSAQIVRNPPIRDDLDIARSGLRPHMQTIPCSPADTRGGGPAKWMELSSDFLMGQQLTMNGTMLTAGIQAPICIGDNVEWDGIVFHIEGVTHSCSIQDGQKTFNTNLVLSHGVAASPGGTDIGIYAGIDRDAQQSFNPGLTVDTPQEIDTDERPGTFLSADLNNTEGTA